MLLNYLLLLVQLVFYFKNVEADVVAITKPKNGAIFDASSGSVTFDIDWIDGDVEDPINEISKYTFTLCTGSNSYITPIVSLAILSPSDAESGTYKITIPSNACGNGVYFIQIYAQTGNGYSNHYSQRFQLIGMNGDKTAIVATDTAPPLAELKVTTGGPGFTINSASFIIPYPLQTGGAKFALMQLQPGTEVTKTTWSRQFPSSTVTYYSECRKSLDQTTTITPGWSYTITLDHNYANHAPMPSQNGGWYDPKERRTLTTRKINFNR